MASLTITTPLAAGTTITNVACRGGSTGAIDLAVSGGTGPYTYAWTGTGIPSGQASQQDLSNLPAGTYNVTVTDAKGCTTTAAGIIGQPASVVLAAGTHTDVLCRGGSTGTATVTASGGTGPYSGTGTFTGLAAGTYSYTVTDANGCTATAAVTIGQPAAVVSVSATGTNPTCANLSGGSITGTIIGGTSPYTVSINGFTSSVSSAGSYIFLGLSGASYTVQVRDANYSSTNGSGCTASSSVVTLVVPTCVAYQGCTLGYWKNHTDRWCSTYNTTHKYGSVFGNGTVEAATSKNVDGDGDGISGYIENLTLLQALNEGGGGAYNLARQSVAALLNICSSQVNYAVYEGNIAGFISAVSDAFKSLNGTTPGGYATYLDGLNNAGCPLGGTPATIAANAPLGNALVAAPTMDIYPNPFSHLAWVDFTLSKSEHFSVLVLDMSGRVVTRVATGVAEAGIPNRFQLSSSEMAEGIYLVRLITDGSTQTKRLTVRK